MEDSLTDLPPNILTEILSRLPIKSIFVSKSACKTFLDLPSSNPYFNSLFSSKATQCLLVQFGDTYKPTRSIHLVDPEIATSSRYGERVKVNPMFRIPKYPVKYFRRFRAYGGGRNKNKFVLLNSCKGLVYFAEQTVCERSFICNPITREYVTVLDYDEEKNGQQLTMGLWLGFSEVENKYKVLRIYCTAIGRPWEVGFVQEFWAQVHVVGSSSWRDIEARPPSRYIDWDTCSVLLNETVCWLCRYPDISNFIVFFDFETEKFGEILPPPSYGVDQTLNRQSMNIGVLGGNLCVTDDTFHFDIWVMKEFGNRDSWTKEFVIDSAVHTGEPIDGPFQPLQFLKNGKILMLWNCDNLVCYDPKEKEFRFLDFGGVRTVGKVVPYTPSFVPLKESLMIDNLVVQNMPREDPDPSEDQ
ncbi:hypothetical protein ABFS83_01G075900 [Erythranthe nasuta]